VRDQPNPGPGATGQQGGATGPAPARRGWPVRALVRDPGGQAATHWPARRRAGCRRHGRPGELDRPAARGAHGCSVSSRRSSHRTSPSTSCSVAVTSRRRAAADVRHLVYASVASADRATESPHLELKW